MEIATEETPKKICTTVLLDDDPSVTDRFGGGHGEVARAIAELIRKESGGKAVAITGSWGCGKSTVSGLVKQELCQTNSTDCDFQVFTFDAWAHQGDPLRRSFLEELIKFLRGKKWTDKQAWQKELDQLAKRREDTKTKSEPSLTWPGRLMAVAALFLPLGYALFDTLGDTVKQDYTFLWIRLTKWGLFFIFLPILIALGTWIWWRPWKEYRSTKFWKTNRSPHEADSVFTLFVRETVQQVRSSTIKTADPTSLEFRDIFTKVLDSVLADEKRTLVVVADNLDRMPLDEARNIWATMRTFFECGNSEDKTWAPRFWLIVPFDPQGARLIWRQGSGEKAEKDDESAESFIDKTFQVTFRVPPAIPSDCKRFFLGQLKAAFPDHEESCKEFDTIYRLNTIERLRTNEPRTPRYIKLLINKVGALHRVWQDNIPLQIQALYVLKSREIGANESVLATSDFLAERILDLIAEPQWQKYLAAIHFGVHPENAMEVLIGDDVTTALSSGDAERLQQLGKNGTLPEICERMLEQKCREWADSEPSSIAMSAYALQLCQSQGWSVSDLCWHHLKQSLRRVKTWKRLNTEIGQGIAALLEKCGEPGELFECGGSVLKAFSIAVSSTGQQEGV